MLLYNCFKNVFVTRHLIFFLRIFIYHFNKYPLKNIFIWLLKYQILSIGNSLFVFVIITYLNFFFHTLYVFYNDFICNSSFFLCWFYFSFLVNAIFPHTHTSNAFTLLHTGTQITRIHLNSLIYTYKNHIKLLPSIYV